GRLALMGAGMLVEALDLLEQGTARYTEQDENRATCTKLLTKEDGKVDFSRSACEINNLIRAMTPWPGCFTEFRGSFLKITAARVHSESLVPHPPGFVFKADKEHLLVACGTGSIEILRLQMCNKKECDACAFVCGYRMEGETLG
ncbi:MAG: methionyl-tRNA formyltransferase, partial [Candidatus Wallbacteria bacterium]|nr:methionyl-tRNA formyltransferase [Candidatus Wallbacteria bacterium]